MHSRLHLWNTFHDALTLTCRCGASTQGQRDWSNTATEDSEGRGGTPAEVNHAAMRSRPVVDRNHDRAAGGQGDAHPAAQRQRGMGGGELVLVIAAARGGAMALPARPAVPGGEPGLVPPAASSTKAAVPSCRPPSCRPWAVAGPVSLTVSRAGERSMDAAAARIAGSAAACPRSYGSAAAGRGCRARRGAASNIEATSTPGDPRREGAFIALSSSLGRARWACLAR